MKKITLALMAASMVFLSGCGNKENAATGPALIKVNNDVITKGMVDASFKTGPLASGNVDVKKPENKFIYLIYKNKTVNDLIVKELLTQEANKRKISISNEEIEAKLNDIMNKVGGKKRFEDSLAQNNLNKDSFGDMVKFDLLKDKLVYSLSGGKTVNEAAIKAFYEKNQDKYFKHADLVRASHILISASEAEIKAKIQTDNKKIAAAELNKKVQAEMDVAKNKAEKILAEVKAKPDKFAEIAKKESQDPSSAEKGGDLGFFSNKEMVPAFSKVAFSTKPGEIVGVVKSEFGYHIIKVVDRKKAGSTPFDEVKPQIQKYLEQQNKMQTMQKLIESLKNNAKIVYLDKEYDPAKIEVEIKNFMKNQKKSQLPMKKETKN